ncbi:MAG: ribosomal protein S6--L-glutamate ligase [Natrialbaceae archaeon]|jgi:ribosomal protein S6--L-glutamate ligase
MITLAVVNRAESFERMATPLAERGVELEHVPATGRSFPLASPARAGPEIDPDAIDVGFVYPGRLMEGAVLDAAIDVPWVNGRDAVLRSRNKAGVIARLSEAGIPVPKTVMLSSPVEEAEILEAADRLGYPLVVKPNSTTRGTGVAKAEDPDSVLGICDYLDLVHDYRATGDKSFLLQEFLPDAMDYRAMVLDGHYAGAVERRLYAVSGGTDGNPGRWKHNVHRGGEATGVDFGDERRELVERVADELDIDILGVDLLETDDRVVITETNARPTIDAATKYEPDFYDRLAALVRSRKW